MTTPTCPHHWLIAAPSGPFSLATCNKCGEHDALRNSIHENAWMQKEVKGTAKRDEAERQIFLKEKIKEKIIEDREKIKKAKKERVSALKETKEDYSSYSPEIKTMVLISLLTNSLIETSRKFKVPESTIRGWKKTCLDYTNARDSGNIEIFKKIISEKIKTEANISKIAKDYGMPRRTLRNWIGRNGI